MVGCAASPTNIILEFSHTRVSGGDVARLVVDDIAVAYLKSFSILRRLSAIASSHAKDRQA